MPPTELRRRFRAVLAGDGVVRPASVFDPVSAQIAGALEFEMALLAGSMASLAVLGAPDLILLTLSELAEQARRICRVSSIPLLVDADHGYGNAMNVRRTVEELEVAGVAALSIEDTDLPARFGQDKASLVSLEEAIGKMRAALEARREPDLVIAGRTNVSLAEPDEAIRRCRAYEDAGVDALFLTGVRQRADLDAVVKSTALPIILGSTTREVSDIDYLKSRRVRIALQGHGAPFAGYRALYEAMKAQRDGQNEENGPAKELIKSLSGEDAYTAFAARYLR
jgi:carboxyvinyl-carboxyphosphonate phosphorylmutase